MNQQQPTNPTPSMRPAMAAGYRERPLEFTQVQPRGLLEDRMRLSLLKLVRDRHLHIKYINWGADQIGRWIGAVAVQAAILDQAVESDLEAAVEELLEAQDQAGLFYGDKFAADSSLGNTRRIFFGQTRALWNLLDYYHLTGDARVWTALQRAADATVAYRDVLKTLNPEWGDQQTSIPILPGIESCLGAMVVLGQQTGHTACIDYARHIADNLPRQVGRPSELVLHEIPPEELVQFEDVGCGHHTHSYLAIAHGMVDLAVATGEHNYLEQARKVFEDTLPSVWMNGNIPEGYGQLFEHRDEICSVVDWIFLGLKLFDATGEVRYLDAAELSILNQLFSGQEFHGGFTYFRSLDRRHWMSDDNWGPVHQACCSMHGGWVLGHIAAHVITDNPHGLSVNLPLEVDVQLQRHGHPLKISQRVFIGPDRLVQTLAVFNGDEAPLTLSIRLPGWCAAPVLRLDGQDQPLDVQSGFASLSCSGKTEHAIELILPLRLQVIPAGKNILNIDAGAIPGEATEESLQYGPFALMFFREMHQQVAERHLAVSVQVDQDGRPAVGQQIPPGWRAAGTIPLFLAARLRNGTEISLTPCANTSLVPFSVTDPYVLRFAEIAVERTRS